MTTMPTDQEIIESLNRNGFLVLRDVSEKDFFSIGYRLGHVEMHPDADQTTGITVITSDSSNLSYEDGRTAQLHHTDGTAVASPPNIVLLYCRVPAQVGGESLFADGRAVYEDLRVSDPALLDAMKRFLVRFGDPRRAQVEAPIFECAEGTCVVRFRDDGYLTYPPELANRVQDIRDVFLRHGTTIKLAAREGYIALNKRVVHGRNAFEDDERTVLRLLVHYAPQDESLRGLHIGFQVAE